MEIEKDVHKFIFDYFSVAIKHCLNKKESNSERIFSDQFIKDILEYLSKKEEYDERKACFKKGKKL